MSKFACAIGLVTLGFLLLVLAPMLYLERHKNEWMRPAYRGSRIRGKR